MFLIVWFLTLFNKKKCQWNFTENTGFGSTNSLVCDFGKERVWLFQCESDGLYYPSFMCNTPEDPNFSFEDLEKAKEFVEEFLTQDN